MQIWRNVQPFEGMIPDMGRPISDRLLTGIYYTVDTLFVLAALYFFAYSI